MIMARGVEDTPLLMTEEWFIWYSLIVFSEWSQQQDIEKTRCD